VIHQVEHVHFQPALAKALDAAQSLLQPRRVPRQIYVDQRPKHLQVQALARRVGGDQQADFVPAHGGLDRLALDCGEFAIADDAALVCAGVDRNRLARKGR